MVEPVLVSGVGLLFRVGLGGCCCCTSGRGGGAERGDR